MTTTITLKQIRKHSPCQDGWEKLLEHLGKTKADDEPLKFSTILESNGSGDAIWCLRALPEEHSGKIRYLAADFAERVLHIFEEKHPNDKRPREAIQGVRDYVEGKITLDELKVFRRAAADAADAAADAADYAADAAADTRKTEIKAQGELLIKYFG